MHVTFGDGLKMNVDTGDFTIPTDQPVESGGNGSAPTPFTYFLASLASCAGIFVLKFCKQRNIDASEIEIRQDPVFDPASGMITNIHLDIHLPPSFPEKYRKAVIRSTEQCAVKKHLHLPPAFQIKTVKPGE